MKGYVLPIIITIIIIINDYSYTGKEMRHREVRKPAQVAQPGSGELGFKLRI